MEYKQQMNLTVLQIKKTTTPKSEGKKRTNLSNHGKQYVDWILQS